MDTPATISGIIFIVVLIVPGVIFKRFYFIRSFKKQFGAGAFADRLITNIFWGLIVQLLSFIIYSKAFNFTYTQIHGRLADVYKVVMNNGLPPLNYHDLGYILGYLVTTVIIAALFGRLCHELVRSTKLDLKGSVFRFSNEWHYYFKGEVLSTKEFKHVGAKKEYGVTKKVILTEVDLVINEGGATKMFSGFLTQYSLNSKSGDLESVYLTNAKRWSDKTNAFKSIPGECFIIPYCNVTSLNLRYVYVEKRQTTPTKIYNNIIVVISLALLLTSLIYPWFSKVPIIDKIISVICLFVVWVAVLVFLSYPTQEEKNKPNAKALTIIGCIGLVSLLFALSKLEIFFVVDYFLSFFHR